jgi:1-phosphofructokinase
VKPNAEELAELTGIGNGEALEIDELAAADAAGTLISRGCRAVLATLGAKGAVLATAEGSWFATMPPIVPRSTVGAGDSSLAGYLLADLRGEGPQRRLSVAVAHGSAAASLPGSTMPSVEQTDPESAVIRALTPIAADH